MKLDVKPVSVRFRRPFAASYGTISNRELVQVTLTDEAGVRGHGEAAALEPYDGVPVRRVLAALERYRPALAGADGLAPDAVLKACSAIDDLPQALAAIDLALWDRAGRVRGAPVATLLCEGLDGPRSAAADLSPLSEVAVNAALSAADRTPLKRRRQRSPRGSPA